MSGKIIACRFVLLEYVAVLSRAVGFDHELPNPSQRCMDFSERSPDIVQREGNNP
jgi:hypothetical protein